jgi:hypothetical protein
MTKPNMSDDIEVSVRIVLVGLLLEHAKGQDPDFSAKARERLDYVLGRFFIDEFGTNEFVAEIRKQVLAHISDPAKLEAESTTKRTTLRRRFLNWLD